MTPYLPFVGVHVFAAWIQQQGSLSEVITLLQQAIQAYSKRHPEEDFPLLHHKEETLWLRLQAIFYAPLFGIGKLTEFDVKEHPLVTLQGRSYQSSTLSQFLGQLERIDAAPALLPALVPVQAGEIGYVDGHMIAFWTRVSMHKGKITMLGRIMAGSQAVIAHNDRGQALFVAYHAPDTRLPHVIVDYCEKVAEATGITLFVIDREVNSVKMACEFEHKGLGLLSMLDANEYEGLSSFNASGIGTLEDGSEVYEGQWNIPRPWDPRRFVIVVDSDRVLVFWGTSLVKETVDLMEWPRVYRERNETQEKSFKRMIAHGALNVNYGIKKIVGPDRHQMRAREEVKQALLASHEKVEKRELEVNAQQEKVAESKEKGHTKRLEQRERRLGEQAEELKEAKKRKETLLEKEHALGEPKTRADRDFRKQTVMTFRTLLLENALRAFVMALWGKLEEKVSLESILGMLFERSGSRVERGSEIIYWINTEGLSLTYQRMQAKVVEGINAMEVRYREKAIRIRLREAPT